MSEHYEQLTRVLGRYLSPIIAQGVINSALRDLEILPRKLTEADLARVVPRLDNGIRLFIDGSRQIAIRGELDALLGAPRSSPATHTIDIRTEPDISTARLRARALCDELSVRPLLVQKVATIVSELARNIVNYTPGGTVDLAINQGPPRHLRIRATDRGPGIENLEEIYSGRYRSRTGMGKGIVGVKRLADRFDMQSGRTGTRITVEVLL